MELIEHFKTRRSVKAQDLTEPGPNEAQLQDILISGMRVPDHGKLAPWRFHVFDGAAQAELGNKLADRFAELNPEANEKQIAFERERPQRAPLLIMVTYQPELGRIPAWEQQLSTGAACMNLVHAAYAHGFAAQWLTEWPAFDAQVKEWLGCTEEGEIAGMIYIGSATEIPEDRPRPDADVVVKFW
ncbi:MAG: nitroreductase [Rickettsiales bacterium]|nr:nitroreductase [Rickettsiales bacterium]